MPQLDDLLKRILTARVYEVAVETPLQAAPALSARLGNEVWIKREDLQSVFSFKVRGAHNRMARLDAAERERGVVTCSAGNHAQGVALAARNLGCPAHIVMPRTSPAIKVDAVRALGADVTLHGDTLDETQSRARELRDEHGWTFIHPFDDLDVIAGQGTIGMELLRQHTGPCDAVFVPVGGGGLAAGIGAYIKALRSDVRVIGVEPVDAASMHAAFAAEGPVALEEMGIFADGVAVREAGQLTYPICREVLDEIVLVDTDAICAAIKDVFEDTRSILEPSGALSVAGLKAVVARDGLRHRHLVAVASGANMNFDRLRHVSERSELGEQREALFAATIPEEPGSFRAFCDLLAGTNITEFNYRYADDREAHVFVGIEIAPGIRAADLLARLEAGGIRALDLTGNEMAKLHLRHLVGGRAPAAARGEVLYRFEFPERPGALATFLGKLKPSWNISLFHYRNHGAETGRVLCGLQIDAGDNEEFARVLADIGYRSWEETDNPAYHLFLG